MGLREDGAHTPGPAPEAVKWLVEERDVHGFGTETIGTDAGQAYHFNPPYPAHFYMHGKGRYGLQCLTNLDLLPPNGAVIVAAPLKIKQRLGQPAARAGAGAGEEQAMSERNRRRHRRSGGIGAEIAGTCWRRAMRSCRWTCGRRIGRIALTAVEVDLLDGAATREAAQGIAARLRDPRGA